MKSSLPIYILIMVISMVFSLTACKDKGPAEKAGEKIDQAVEETKEDLEQTKEKIEDKMKQ
ncbi:MAG: hypothetical protein RQ722_02955 [Desulfuromonadales bacterium]|nr:hypothetical protein [Desulfuromonadales bacterium]